MAAAAILNFGYLDFLTTPMSSKKSSNIPTKFGDDWINSKKLAIVLKNSR